MDQMINAITSGQTYEFVWNKITGGTAYSAGRWYDFTLLNGTPVANNYPGTALQWRPCNEATGNGTQTFGIPHGGDVSPLLKHVLNMSAWTTSSTGVPGCLWLVDIEGYYPGINMNTTAVQNLSGTPTLRAPNGLGVRMFLVITATAGSTAHNLSYSYTNQNGVSGRTNPVTVACTASAIVGHITHSGTASNNYGPFLPLANGDTGIRSVQSVQLSAASGGGTAALVLCVPIAKITLSVQSLMTEKDLLNQIPSLPRVRDGACLGFLYGSGAATAASSTFAGTLQFVWG